MKFKDLENKSINELYGLLNDLKAESFTLGWKNKTQQLDQSHKIKLVRRDIARVLTAIKQKSTSQPVESKATTKSKATKKEEKGDK